MKRFIVATAIASLVVPIMASGGEAFAQDRPDRNREMTREQARRPDSSGSTRGATPHRQ